MKFYRYLSLFSLLAVKILAAENTQCKQSAEQYSDCIAGINGQDFDKMCSAYVNEKCQQLFKSPSTVLIGCDKEFIDRTTQVFSGISEILKFTCAKDEQGNYCPLSGIIQKTQTSPDTFKNQKFSDIFERLNSSCSSQTCVDVSLTYLNSIKSMASSDDEVKEINNLISHLSSCTTSGGSNSDNTAIINGNNNGETIPGQDGQLGDLNAAPIGTGTDINQNPTDGSIATTPLQDVSGSVSNYILSYAILAITLIINLYIF
ncbi:hypothetical protein BCR32DRAFT_328728, partial [Anaeromyces robustus]